MAGRVLNLLLRIESSSFYARVKCKDISFVWINSNISGTMCVATLWEKLSDLHFYNFGLVSRFSRQRAHHELKSIPTIMSKIRKLDNSVFFWQLLSIFIGCQWLLENDENIGVRYFWILDTAKRILGRLGIQTSSLFVKIW